MEACALFWKQASLACMHEGIVRAMRMAWGIRKQAVCVAATAGPERACNRMGPADRPLLPPPRSPVDLSARQGVWYMGSSQDHSLVLVLYHLTFFISRSCMGK